ncbi:hypothetical protein COCOBI_16-0870 [Coccomyxa sp. Obi]|nr:hypothetical protein COCOBI_16-0870 [Coccomyxa sp. Obi]
METTDSLVDFESSGPFEWHIHVGEGDFEALKRSGWDSQVCYLDLVPQKGLSSRRPKCPSGCTSIADALGSGHADCMRYWHGRPIASLAVKTREGYDEYWRLCKREYPSCKQAARWPTAEVLMYAHGILGLSWDADTCAAAAAAGSIDCLSYAHCSGCPWRPDVCSSAAAAGSLQCLRYAHEQGCCWSGRTCLEAAAAGDLDCLMHCFGGCELPPLRGGKVGERVLALLQERRAAVLLSFHAAGRKAQAYPRKARLNPSISWTYATSPHLSPYIMEKSAVTTNHEVVFP